MAVQLVSFHLQIGEEQLEFEMQEISQVMGDITNVVIRVEAEVLEYFIDETRFGTSNKAIFNNNINLHQSF